MAYRAFKVLSSIECSSVVENSNSIFLKNVLAHSYRSLGVEMHLFCKIDQKGPCKVAKKFHSALAPKSFSCFNKFIKLYLFLYCEPASSEKYDEFIEARKEHSVDDETLKARCTMVKTVMNTWQYHFYILVDDSRVSCRIFSAPTKSVIEDVVKTEVNKKECS